MAMGVVEAIYKFKYFIFCRQKKKHRENGKSTGKTQGNHREFGINCSVATLTKFSGGGLGKVNDLCMVVRRYSFAKELTKL